nr:TonB-dependent receptor [Candidatus Eremiobacteraeota bacterium]
AVTAHADGMPDASQTIDVQTDQIAVVNLQIGALKEIGHAVVTARAGVSGTPVSQNAIGRSTIATLPGNNSLNTIVQTVPGIVKFSYNEPVAHGFHGLTYELDGAPLPQATSANFSEVIDPKSVDSLEIFTGAFPAEFGGSRQGAVVNIVSNRATDLTGNAQGTFSLGAGNYDQAIATLNEQFKSGAARVFLTANTGRNSRGLDAPTFSSLNNNSSLSDELLRIIAPAGKNATLAFDYSNQFAQFQIPINTDPNNPRDPVFAVAATNDVQKEYDRFANLNYTRTSKDGSTISQVIPWWRYTRIAYDGDLGKDVLGMGPNPAFLTDPTQPPLLHNVGLRQDRFATYAGVRASTFHASAHHAVKAGVDLSRENFTSNATFAQFGLPPASDTVTQPGALVGIYAEDKWSPSRAVSVSYGLRYDHSTGFSSGNQLSPRIGLNYAPDAKNIVHFYYGRLYSAPALEDTRRDCILLGASPTCDPKAPPVYDLQPERDSYYEMGVAHQFGDAMSGYVNLWGRSVSNVLDTTQLANTPLFAVFNNTIGRAQGVEFRLQGRLANTDSYYFSGTVSQSQAGGISGSTFLFGGSSSPYPLSPEDHDQTYEANTAYTHKWGSDKSWFATLQAEYGSGYPVQFENVTTFQTLSGRLPVHTTLDLSLGKNPGTGEHRSLGFNLDVQNLLDHQYVVKIANGFNTTQITSGRNILFRVTAPL